MPRQRAAAAAASDDDPQTPLLTPPQPPAQLRRGAVPRKRWRLPGRSAAAAAGVAGSSMSARSSVSPSVGAARDRYPAPDRLFSEPTWWVVDGGHHSHGELLQVDCCTPGSPAEMQVWNECRRVPWGTLLVTPDGCFLGSWVARRLRHGAVDWLDQSPESPSKSRCRTLRWLRHRAELHPPIPFAGGKFRLRFGRPTDVDDCLRLEGELVAAHRQIKGWERKRSAELHRSIWPAKAEGEEDPDRRRAKWASVLGDTNDYLTLLTEQADDEEVVGMLHLSTPRPPEIPYAEIHQVSVTASQRNSGIGEHMLRHTVDLLGAGTEFRLHVGTRAARMYQRCGFQLIDRFRTQDATFLQLSYCSGPRVAQEPLPEGSGSDSSSGIRAGRKQGKRRRQG
eukprot:TRINITY_DN13340_c0_g1_i1.p1 TRINITY_DN13340_c0_g1~~TRINITY_DN13340_c0_g1_i1.p1  ORF type:complete len:420 (+),score=112.45 TRINITY_DN13340_c0_g1_i1:79-1260(+)